MPQDVVAVTGEALARRTLELDELAAPAGARPGGRGNHGGPGGPPTVAAYVSIGGEPSTRALLDRLRAAGCGCCCPSCCRTTISTGRSTRAPNGSSGPAGGCWNRTGPRLGPEAVTQADVVLLPGLAVDRGGLRLGRGGGSYDRVLARLERAGARASLVVLLYDAEVLAEVPAEPHDRHVHAAVTPSAVHRFTAPGGRTEG